MFARLLKLLDGCSLALDHWITGRGNDQPSEPADQGPREVGYGGSYYWPPNQPRVLHTGVVGEFLGQSLGRRQNMQKPHLLLEKVTVLAQHVEGGVPRWRLTNPQDQHAVGVHTWRQINGAWVETLWHRRSETNFACYRVRMIDPEHRLKGFPEYVELYDIVGDTERQQSNFDIEDVSAMLLAGLKRAGF